MKFFLCLLAVLVVGTIVYGIYEIKLKPKINEFFTDDPEWDEKTKKKMNFARAWIVILSIFVIGIIVHSCVGGPDPDKNCYNELPY